MERDTAMEGKKPPVELQGLLERLLTEAEEGDMGPGAEGGSDSSASTLVRTPPGEGGALPGGLLANPALLTALPALAENLGPLLSRAAGGVGTSPSATRPRGADRHTALLCAIKPYLSPGRQEAAETVIRLCRVWDALERSGISLSGLLAGMDGGARGGDGTVAVKTDGEVT